MLRVAIVESKEIAKEIIYDLQDILEGYEWEFRCYPDLSHFVNRNSIAHIDILVLPKKYNRQRVYHALIEPYPNLVVICTCENTQDGMIDQILYINRNNIEKELDANKFEIRNRLKGRDIFYFQYNQVKVPLKIMDIQYIEKTDKYLVYHTKRGQFKERGSIYEKEAFLESYDFIRIHSSFLVNERMILKIVKDMVVLNNQQQLPIARARKKQVVEKLNNG